MGMRRLDAGTTQIIFSSIIIWGATLSTIFLGSSFSGVQVLGIMLLLLAILLIQHNGRRLKFNKGFLCVAASAPLFAIFQVASATLSQQLSTATYLLLTYMGPSTLIGIIYFQTIRADWSKLIHQLKNSIVKTFLAGGVSLLYYAALFIAYRTAPDRGVVIVLLTTQVILTVLFGIIFLGETKHIKRKLVAAVLALIAVALIKS